jgi:DNA-binding response OmpR family regulator
MHHVPLLDGPVDAAVQDLERAYAEFEILRRRIERVRDAVEAHRRKVGGNNRRWFEVDAAAKRALAALTEAVEALPPLPAVSARPAAVYELAPHRIAVTERRVTFKKREVRLAQMEFALLVALAREPRRVYTKTELLRDVWGYPSSVRTRPLDSHASRLRRKLIAAGAPKGRYVVAVWGVGYSLVKSS